MNLRQTLLASKTFFFSNLLIVWLVSGLYIVAIPHWFYTPLAVERSFVFSFVLLSWLGYMGGLYALGYLVCIFPLQLLIRSRLFQAGISMFLLSLFLLVLITDSQVYRLFDFHINAFFLSVFFTGDLEQWFAISGLEFFLMMLVVTAVLVTELLLARVIWRKTQPLSVSNKSLVIACGFIIVSLIGSFFLYAKHSYRDKVTVQDPLIYAAKYSAFAKSLAFPFYQSAWLSIPFVAHNADIINVMGRDIVATHKKNYQPLYYPKKPLAIPAAVERPNVFIIVVDTWRKETIRPEIMPKLHQFLGQAAHYTHHFSGGNSTYAGLFSLFFSIPSTLSSLIQQSDIEPVLLNVLAKLNYDIDFFSSSVVGDNAYVNALFHHRQAVFVQPGSDPDIRDSIITASFIDSLKKNQQPMFRFLLLDAAHGFCDNFSYMPLRKNYISRCNRIVQRSDNLNRYLARYYNALYFIDGQLDKIISALKERKLYDNSLIIITGDHGESFFDYKGQPNGHSSNFSAYQLQTPLVIKWPNSQHAGKQYDFRSTHYDVVPTIIKGILAIKTPEKYYSVGQSLTSKAPRADFFVAASYTDFGVIGLNKTYVVSRGGLVKVFENNQYQPLPEQGNSHVLREAFKQLRYFHTPLRRNL